MWRVSIVFFYGDISYDKLPSDEPLKTLTAILDSKKICDANCTSVGYPDSETRTLALVSS